jgi:iron complex transport system substrate-binding protein
MPIAPSCLVGLFCCPRRGSTFSSRKIVNYVMHSRLSAAIHAAIVALCWCAVPARAQTAPATSSVSPAYREVTDEAGRTVRIPQPVRRIVSLVPSLTETIYALGLQDNLVGDTDYCDYPPEAQKKTKVGGIMNPSLEEIVALHPDLVLMAKGLNRIETVHSLESLGIASYGADPHNVDEIMTSVKKLADVLGAPEAGASVVSDMRHKLEGLHDRLSSRAPKRVLFVVWTQPLISVGKDTFIADALRHAGALSIVDSEQDWPQVSLEEIVRLQPEFLVLAASHSEDASREIERLDTLPGWQLLEAVTNRRYAVISDAVKRPAPRIISAIEDLARQLHPDAFAEKPEGSKEKMDKENPAPKPPAQAYFRPLDLQRENANRSGCVCAI